MGASAGSTALGWSYPDIGTPRARAPGGGSHRVCDPRLGRPKGTKATRKHSEGFVICENIRKKIFKKWSFSRVTVKNAREDFGIIWFYAKKTNVTVHFSGDPCPPDPGLLRPRAGPLELWEAVSQTR